MRWFDRESAPLRSRIAFACVEGFLGVVLRNFFFKKQGPMPAHASNELIAREGLHRDLSADRRRSAARGAYPRDRKIGGRVREDACAMRPRRLTRIRC